MIVFFNGDSNFKIIIEGTTVCINVAAKKISKEKFPILTSYIKWIIAETLTQLLHLQHHGGAELCRFCEGFFLQNMDQLLDREDFHSLLLGGLSQELLYPGLGTRSGLDQDQDLLVLLRDLENVLIQRLYILHSACRE